MLEKNETVTTEEAPKKSLKTVLPTKAKKDLFFEYVKKIEEPNW